MNLWPPFLANNIRVLAITDDWGRAWVVLRLRPWNRKYVGSQFGGNLFAMTDPFQMVLALHRLGPDYLGLGRPPRSNSSRRHASKPSPDST